MSVGEWGARGCPPCGPSPVPSRHPGPNGRFSLLAAPDRTSSRRPSGEAAPPAGTDRAAGAPASVPHALPGAAHARVSGVHFAVRLVGLALLLLGIAAAVLLVLDVVLGRWPALVACAFVVGLGVVAWYVLPLRQRRPADG